MVAIMNRMSESLWFWYGVTLESVCNMLWCVLFRMDSLTPSMLSWLIANAISHVCTLAISVCIWSFLDTRKKNND